MFLTTMQATFPQTARPTIGRRGLAAALLTVLLIAAVYWAPGDLTFHGRLALIAFGLSVIGWTLTKLNDTFVALLAALGLVLTHTIDADEFFASIGNSVVWLMIGAFIVARALNQSGLSARLTYAMTRSARTVDQLFYLLTAVLLLTALVIPSTSGRAALLVPVYQAIATSLQNPRINRALALALPVNILLTAIGSLVGAGAHLVINDTLAQMTGSRFSFGEWMLMGMPFAVVSAFTSTWVILHLFLNRQERRLRLDAYLRSHLPKPGAWTRQERYIALVALALVALWATEAWHGVDNALVAVFGALAVTVPSWGALKFKEAAKGVEWEMILFVSASLALSDALVRSGAGRWLVDLLMVRSGLSALGSQLAILTGVAVITLTSHLYITSRSARGAVIAPLVILLALSMKLDPHVLAWVTAAGVGYCITLVVSAKPLAMFQQMNSDQPAYTAGDLARLSGVLAPLHLVLILLFALFYWPQMARPAQAAGSPSIQVDLMSSPVMRQTPGLLRERSLAPNALLAEAGVVRTGGEFTFVPAPACTCQLETSKESNASAAPQKEPALGAAGSSQNSEENKAGVGNSNEDSVPTAIPATPTATPTVTPTATPTATPTMTPVLTVRPGITPTPPMQPGDLDDDLEDWTPIDDDDDEAPVPDDDDLAPIRTPTPPAQGNEQRTPPAPAPPNGDDGDQNDGEDERENDVDKGAAPSATPLSSDHSRDEESDDAGDDVGDDDSDDDSNNDGGDAEAHQEDHRQNSPSPVAPPTEGDDDDQDDDDRDDDDQDGDMRNASSPSSTAVDDTDKDRRENEHAAQPSNNERENQRAEEEQPQSSRDEDDDEDDRSEDAGSEASTGSAPSASPAHHPEHTNDAPPSPAPPAAPAHEPGGNSPPPSPPSDGEDDENDSDGDKGEDHAEDD